MTAWVLTAMMVPLAVTAAWADSPSLDHLITKVAIQEKMDPDLLRAVVATESDFNVQTVSPDGAAGLMQLMPETARILGVKNLFNPEQNLRGGARYLNQMLKQFTSIPHALAAYNAGPTVVSRFQGIPPLPETQRYVGKVMSYYKKNASKQKNSMRTQNNLNDKIRHSDVNSLAANKSRTDGKNVSHSVPLIPMPSIRRTNILVRHEIALSMPKPSRSAQFAMAISEPVDGETVPILRASR